MVSGRASVAGALSVVKLGGSLFGAGELRAWLGMLAEVGPVVVVPGGGPFADAVREAQARLGFGEVAAHRMAILGMQQYGVMLQGLEPRLGSVETEGEIVGLRGAAVWLPWRMAGRDEGIEASWEVSSDSLALWLARKMGAARLLLVKSGAVTAGWRTPGLVDQAFAGLAGGYGGSILCLGRGELRAGAAFLGDGRGG